MIRRLAQIRLSRLQIGLVALVSAIATAVVIADGSPGRTPLQAAVLAALERNGVVIHQVGAGGGAGAATDPASSTPAASPVSADASPSSTAASTSSSGGSGGGGSSTTSTTGSTTTTTGGSTQPKTYKVKHVFVIALSTTSYQAAFGHGSVARYLNGTLVPKGTLLTQYRSLGESELSDYTALISGQAPNADTGAGCANYNDFPSGTAPDGAGEVSGDGCVYPDTVLTIGDQVTASGKVWKAYLDDMGSSTCVHPNSGAPDGAVLAGAGPEYDTRHNPFIYFHSLLDLGDCSADDEALTQLPSDLGSASKTATYSFIAPGLCDDSDQTACPGGQPGGLAGEDAFLRRWVPKIIASKAYKQDGALMIVSAISKPASTTGASGPTGPAGAVGAAGSGSQTRAGALVISPYTSAGKKISASYDPYSLLRSIEDLFGYSALAHAAKAKSFIAAALPGA
jgi:phosphatidylinositol-3-phosphatase